MQLGITGSDSIAKSGIELTENPPFDLQCKWRQQLYCFVYSLFGFYFKLIFFAEIERKKGNQEIDYSLSQHSNDRLQRRIFFRVDIQTDIGKAKGDPSQDAYAVRRLLSQYFYQLSQAGQWKNNGWDPAWELYEWRSHVYMWSTNYYWILQYGLA